MRRPAFAVTLLFALVLPLCLYGCRRQTPPPAPVVSYARVDAIAKSSGGNWDRVPPADQKFLIQEYGHGNQRVATMIFNRRAAALAATRRWDRRLDALVEKSGGDWSKLSPREKNYLIDIIGKGDEKAAIKTFQDRADLKKTAAHVTR